MEAWGAGLSRGPASPPAHLAKLRIATAMLLWHPENFCCQSFFLDATMAIGP